MRKVYRHEINPYKNNLDIEVLDEPGPGGASHLYLISGSSNDFNVNCSIRFQKGPIIEEGVNGVTHEALIAIIIDRLESFQNGPFPCRENALALTKLEEALFWLQHRTSDRQRRGVEGRTAP